MAIRFLRKGDHWAALHDIEPDHLLYVVARNAAPSDIELERLKHLAAYSHPLARWGKDRSGRRLEPCLVTASALARHGGNSSSSR